jgi:2'-5' RNA ligase
MPEIFNFATNKAHNMPRLFVGIKIENQHKLELLSSGFREKLKLSDINWVPAKNYHLTLKFIGDVDSHLIGPISTVLAHIGSKHNSFSLNYNKPGFFGTLTDPRVIWFDFKQNPELNLLQGNIDKSLTELGFDIENKKYAPHLTFARVKKLNKENNFKELFTANTQYAETIDIDEFQLFQSVLNKEGPVYFVLDGFKLRPAK